MQKVARRKDVSPKEGEQKYGKGETFADAKNKKYPLTEGGKLSEERIRAAWNYINKQKNADKYSAADVKTIKANIVKAWKAKIDKAGPPAAQKKTEKVFHIDVPLAKVQEGENGELFVEGFLVRTDTPDHTPGLPEQMDEALSAPHFESWIEETKRVSKGLSLFNAREMHKAVAAGRGLEFKHVPGQGFWGRSEVVDAETKEKVRKGVITSHSIGGLYGKTWIENGVLHYEGIPTEVSYVDKGMVPGTEFEYVKADGSTEMRKFETVENGQEAKDMSEIKKFIQKFSSLRKAEGGYDINQDYARQESWDVNTAARLLADATMLMYGEATEPEDAKEVAAIMRMLQAFIAGEIDEMESAATGEAPEADGEGGEEVEDGESESEEEPEADAEKDGEEEAGAEDEEEPEGDDAAVEMDEEKVKEIVRELLAEMAEANKAERAGELAKVQSALDEKSGTLDKAVKNLAGNLEKVTRDLARDIAKVVTGHNALSETVATLQKTVESYGPVLTVAPRKNGAGSQEGTQLPEANGQNEKEKSVLKNLIADPKIGPMLKQAYQARITELEILEGKPLEEPPLFIKD